WVVAAKMEGSVRAASAACPGLRHGNNGLLRFDGQRWARRAEHRGVIRHDSSVVVGLVEEGPRTRDRLPPARGRAGCPERKACERDTPGQSCALVWCHQRVSSCDASPERRPVQEVRDRPHLEVARNWFRLRRQLLKAAGSGSLATSLLAATGTCVAAHRGRL